ncbi:Acyl transferase/acyl hydrolase/lysophospholipase [Penicillium expansum]|uniref:Acyl transferase/acyl hydrolase/lysophospholipase n=1 Tax=Penicillium expansum TaxID=27334 RepID=A0A0A2K8Q1_PENEN|nr:Acyl transferase/acyl hydrolase/lysophospholipase [Penicillium expansum]KGO60765.1 Acyl transferase/acyl hydrolase/lysophospholipase [Penicillium expansum]
MPGRLTTNSAPTDMEGIAVIGMGCRFSGGATSIENFWQMLCEGRTGHGTVPTSRYEASAWHHPSHERKGAINHDSGFFLQEDPSRFDAPFFSITAKEAAGMDPAQRLLLEVAYETFENSGIPIDTLPGSNTAVYSGSMTNDYELLSTRDIYDMPHNSATGNGRTMLANRLSWFFDLQGPSIMMDTACSSSLTAVHLAAQSLRSGECGMALVTGASLILHPNFTQRLSYMHMMSADGISHSFDESANGYGRGEGIGAVLLKPLSAALADGDNIRAIIRGTGINQDGRTPGITLPSPTSQANLIRSVYERHGISMRDTSYFEAHGTGTPVGDPIELSAVGMTLGQARTPTDEPIYVGSVKTNFGHTEGAAGVASLIKVVLCLEKGTLVPNAGFKNINPKIRLDDWRLRLSDKTIPWPDHLPQRASINSFGFGGSNAHLILESTKEAFQGNAEDREPAPHVVVFSTFDQAGIERAGQNWSTFLQRQQNAEQEFLLKDLAHTMLTRRSQLGFRSFAVANSQDQLRSILDKGLPKFPRASRKAQTRLAFVFTGQGGQWAGMGRELLRISTFRESIARSQDILSSLGCPFDIVEEIKAEAKDSQINRPDRSQPITCALQIALVDLLASWSVYPNAVVGHSSGEIAAGYAGGYLSHEDALRVAWFRGFFSQQIAQSERRGGMLATGISAADAQKYLEELPPRSVVVACVNSPASTTLSGDVDFIDQLEARLQQDGHFARKLRIDTAYHSPHMEDLVEVVGNAINCIKPEDRYSGSIPMLSSVTTERVYPAELSGSYWVRNMVSSVEFTAAVTQLANLSESIKSRRRPVPIKWTALVEIGPHAVLKGPVNQILQSVNANMASLPYHSLVSRNQNALRTALEVAGSLWSTGHTIDLAAVNSSVDTTKPTMLADLPSYPWNHQTSFWHEPLETAQLRQRKHPRHDILGAAVDYQNALEPRWRNFLRLSENPWMADHVVAGSIVFPAAGMLVMATEAARQLADGQANIKGIEFQDLHFMRGVVIPDDERGLETLLQVSPHPGMPGWYQFGIFSLPSGGAWIQHAKGAFITRYENRDDDEHNSNWEAALERIKNTQTVAKMADVRQAREWLSNTGGLTVGPAFQTITGVSFCDSESRLWLSGVVTDTKQSMPFENESPSFIHPTTLDCLFQSALLSCSDALSSNNANIPVGVDNIYISNTFQPQPGEQFVVHTETKWRDGKSRSQCIASDSSWSQPWVTFEGVHLGRLPFNPNSQKKEEASSESRYSSIVWDEHLESPLVTSQIHDGSKNTAVQASSLQLIDWIKRLCHTNGDARALITASDTSTSWIENLQELIPSVGKRPCLGKITVASCADKQAEGGTPTENSLPGTHLIPLATLDELPSSSLAQDKYDLVVIDEPRVWEDKTSRAILPCLITILEHGGLVAIRVSDTDLNSAAEKLQRFDGLEIHSTTEDRKFIIVRRTPVSWTTDSEIYVLSPADNSNSFPVFEHLEKIFAIHNVRIVSVGLDQVATLAGKTVISFLDLARPWVSEWTEKDLKRLQELIRAQYVLWVSPSWAQGDVENIGSGATGGLLRTLRNEQWNTAIPHLLVDLEDWEDKFGLACGILQVMQLTTQKNSRRPDLEYRLANGRLLVPRVLETPVVDEAMHTLINGPRPVLSDLTLDPRPLELKFQDAGNARWEEQQLFKDELRSDHTEIKVEMATIFDLHGDQGKIPETALPMFEIVGRVTRVGTGVHDSAVGDKVLTLASANSGLSTTMQVLESDTIRIPANTDPTKAISTPLAYLNAYQILTQVGHLSSSSSVLLVGSISQTLQAMIDYALAMKMQVIVATDSLDTTERLRTRYPVLADRILGVHGSLETSVSRLTNGCGVDASICFLGGYPGRNAAKCLVQGGQYINLSSEMKLSALPESFIDSGCTFSSPRLQKTFSEKPGNLHASVRHVIDFMKQHRMLDRVESYSMFPISDLQGALKHCKATNARAIVDLQAPGKVPIVLPLPDLTGLPTEGTYILAGGLGNLGLALADTLVQSGARHLVFLGRSGGTQPSQQLSLDLLRDRGCRIDVLRCDISQQGDIDHLSYKIRSKSWTVAGVIQCTTVLKDAMFENMTFSDWTQSTESKIRGTLNLHHLFSDKEGLTFFVALSSVASVIGNMGQANYSAGNGFIDALMEWRRNHGLPGHSINIGLVPDASGLSDISEDQEQRRRRYKHLEGTEIMTHELQTLLRVIINSKLSLPSQIIAGMTDSLSRSNGSTGWVLDRKFDHRLCLAVEDTEDSIQTSALLKESSSLNTATEIVLNALSEYLADAMATTADAIDSDLPLSALGVDSLKATAVQNWVSRELGAELSSFEFLGSQPAKALARKIASTSSFVSVPS